MRIKNSATKKLQDVEKAYSAFDQLDGRHPWMEQVPEGIHPRTHALATLQPQAITASAGDMIIWHQALPHCATPNHGSSPRMVQYLSYIDENHLEAKEWI